MAEYIEREVLEVALNHRLNFLMAENDEYDHYTRGFDEAVTRVEDFPAADVTPVRHGRWIPFNESEISGFNPELAGCDPIAGYRCSECGAEAILDCNDQFVLSKCCHDCGARMMYANTKKNT